MRISTPTFREVEEVAHNMRDTDIQELAAIYPFDDRTSVADAYIKQWRSFETSGLCCYLENGDPVAIGLTIMSRPNVITLSFISTDDFGQIAKPGAKYLKGTLFPNFQAKGVHRIETVTVDGYEVNHRWLGMLGLKHEAEHKMFGKNGETFHTFAWTKDVRQVSN